MLEPTVFLNIEVCGTIGDMKQPQIIIPASLSPQPSPKEISAAKLLAGYFRKDIEFVLRAAQSTPDFLIDHVFWELKSPTGKGKHNIQHILQDAARQSPNVICDTRYSKMHPSRIRCEVRRQFHVIRSIKRLVLIEKSGKVIEIFR